MKDSKEILNKWVKVRLTETQKAKLDAYCMKHSITISDLLRDRLQDILEEQ